MHDYIHRLSTLSLLSYARWQRHLNMNGRNIHGAIRFSLPWMPLEVSHLDRYKAAISPTISNSIETLSFDTN